MLGKRAKKHSRCYTGMHCDCPKCAHFTKFYDFFPNMHDLQSSSLIVLNILCPLSYSLPFVNVQLWLHIHLCATKVAHILWQHLSALTLISFSRDNIERNTYVIGVLSDSTATTIFKFRVPLFPVE